MVKVYFSFINLGLVSVSLQMSIFELILLYKFTETLNVLLIDNNIRIVC